MVVEEKRLRDLSCSEELSNKLLSDYDENNFLSELNGWIIEYTQNKYLVKDFTFKDFKASFQFVQQVVLLSESQNHHPDITFGYGKVQISLFTHKVSGLTENDFILASKIDLIL